MAKAIDHIRIQGGNALRSSHAIVGKRSKVSQSRAFARSTSDFGSPLSARRPWSPAPYSTTSVISVFTELFSQIKNLPESPGLSAGAEQLADFITELYEPGQSAARPGADLGVPRRRALEKLGQVSEPPGGVGIGLFVVF